MDVHDTHTTSSKEDSPSVLFTDENELGDEKSCTATAQEESDLDLNTNEDKKRPPIMGMMVGVFMLIYGTLLLVGAAMSLADFDAARAFMLLAFSCFIGVALFSCASFTEGNFITESCLSIVLYFSLSFITSFVGGIMMQVGTGMWFSRNLDVSRTGILLVTTGSFLVVAFFLLRIYRIYHTHMRYKTTSQSLLSRYLDIIAIFMYTVASLILLLGSIVWLLYYRSLLNTSLQTGAIILWIIAASLYLIAGMFQIVGHSRDILTFYFSKDASNNSQELL